MKVSIILVLLLVRLLQPLFGQTNQEQQTSSEIKTDTVESGDNKYVIQYRNPERFLALDKGGIVKRIHYYQGDELTFKRFGDKRSNHTDISSIGMDYFTSFNLKTKLEEVKSITLYSKSWFVNQGSFYFPMFGLLYFLADMVNPYFYGGEAFYVTPGTLRVTGGFVASGLLLHLLKKRVIKINNRHQIKIIERY